MKINYTVRLLTLLGFLFIVVGCTWGIIDNYRLAHNNSLFTPASLVVILDDPNELEITSDSVSPMLDSLAIEKVPYHFALKNTGDNDIDYRLKLFDDQGAITSCGCQDSLLDKAIIKYQLTSGDNLVSSGFLSDLNDLVIDEGVIPKKTVYNYQLWLWISSDVYDELLEGHYHGKVISEIKKIQK